MSSTSLICYDPMKLFSFCLFKVSALKTMASQGGPKYTLSQQPWAQPGIYVLLFRVPLYRMLINVHSCRPCFDNLKLIPFTTL